MWAVNQITSMFQSIGIEEKNQEEPLLAEAEALPAADVDGADPDLQEKSLDQQSPLDG